MDAEERRRFVRDNISLVAASANSKVKREDGAPASIIIHSGELHEQSR